MGRFAIQGPLAKIGSEARASRRIFQAKFETGFQSSADGNVAMHHRSKWDGFRLQSEKGKYICRWKRDYLVFSRLQPYDTWQKLLNAAMPFWSAYRKIGDPAIIEGINPPDIPPVAENELLARFILNSNEKQDDGNVNHKLFMPYKWTELFVNRHREASTDETWSICFEIASQRNKLLYGLANIRMTKTPPDFFQNKPRRNAKLENALGLRERSTRQRRGLKSTDGLVV